MSDETAITTSPTAQMDETEIFTKEIDAALDRFEGELGIPKNQKVEPPKYIYMTLNEIQKTSPQELSEASFLIGQYSMYIQRCINKNRAWERWAKLKIDELAAMNLPNIDRYYGSFERMQLAKNTSPLCKKVNSLWRTVSMRLERLYGIPDNLKVISDSIKEIRFMQLRKEKN